MTLPDSRLTSGVPNIRARIKKLYDRICSSTESGFSADQLECRPYLSGKVYGVSGDDSIALAKRVLECMISGACPVPLNRDHPYVKAYGTRFIWPDANVVPPVSAFYACQSSGSTGSSRLYFFSELGAVANAELHARSLGVAANSTVIQSLPLTHSFGIIAYLMTAAIMDCQLIFQRHPFDWLNISQARSFLHLTPDHLKRILRMQFDWPEDITVTIGAGGASLEEMNAIALRVKNVFVTYGQTEAGPRVSTGRWKTKSKLGYVGEPLSEISVKLEPRSSNSLEGELLIKSPSLAIALDSSRLTDDGYLRSGDLFRAGSDGELYFIQRIYESFKWRGKLYQVEAIRKSARENGIQGTVILQFVSSAVQNFAIYAESEKNLSEWANHLESHFKIFPARHFLPQLPRNNMGKIIFSGLAENESSKFFIF